MKLIYEETQHGLRILRCYGLDGIIEIPEQIEGKPVTELASYLFSETVRGRELPPEEYEGEPELKGSQIRQLTLPPSIKKIGPYAFYNCYELTKLTCCSAIYDWGAGVFTGCGSIRTLDICVLEGKRSCFKEILSELRQTLEVAYRDGEGELKARLIFPEYFEESVENTPARIIMREMHGCGHMYRYCFDEREFRFQEYDGLFPHVKVQEKPELVTQLSVYRLYWSCGLGSQAEAAYREYLKEHMKECTSGLIQRGEIELLRWLIDNGHLSSSELEAMAEAAAGEKDPVASALVMDGLYRRSEGASVSAKGRVRSRTFEL